MSSDPVSVGIDDVIIDASGVGKCYQIYDRPSHRLLQGLFGDSKRFYREFWALRGIDLQVRRGETLGIIGKNGSGKSTLLQMIAGTLAPTEGRIEIQGRIAALLELGSGFNPDFTGRENVFLNASILGLSSAQIDSRLENILDFADIGEFIDQPIRNYSSGMVMRLAFSVMAHVDADMLIIDEALAVGDAFFTQKCMRFLRAFKERGTLLFVSHDAGAITGLCDRAIWLDHGQMKLAGQAGHVVNEYLKEQIQEREGTTSSGTRIPEVSQKRAHRDVRQELFDRSTLRNDILVPDFHPDSPSDFGVGGAAIVDVALVDESGLRLASISGGEDVRLEIDVSASTALEGLIVGFFLKDRLGQMLFGDNTYLSTMESPVHLQAGERVRAQFSFSMPRLQEGDYFITVGVAAGTQIEHVVQSWMHEALRVRSLGTNAPSGIIGIPMRKIMLTQQPFHEL